MYKILLLAVGLYISTASYSQQGLKKHFQEKIKYPDYALENNVSGLVLVNFRLNEKSEIDEKYIFMGKGNGCSKAVLNAIEETNWKDYFNTTGKKILLQLPVLFVHESSYRSYTLADNITLDTISHRKENKSESDFEYIAVMPEFPGGEDKLMKFISKEIRYPKQAIKNNTMGRILLNFVIQESGIVDSVRISRGIGDGCDDEGIRVVSAMPKWKAGMQNGKLVKVMYTLPITFALDENKKELKKYNDIIKLDTVKIYSNKKFKPVSRQEFFNLPVTLRRSIISNAQNISDTKNGIIEASFKIAPDGYTFDINIIKGISSEYDEAVKSAIAKLPAFVFIFPEPIDITYKVKVPFYN